MGKNLPITLSALFRNRKGQVNKWLRSFPTFWKKFKEEVQEYVSCPDCVAYYYVFDNYFLIPCRKPQSVLCVSCS